MWPLARARAATQWKAYTYQPVSTVASTLAFKQLIDNFQKASGGAVETTLHLGGSLPIQANNITPAVSQGIIQLADDGFATGNVQITGILRLPMLLLSLDEMLKAMAIIRPNLDRDYARKNAVVLGQYAYPFQVLWGRKKLTSLADVKGPKIRVTSVEEGELISGSGAFPSPWARPTSPPRWIAAWWTA